MFFCSNMNRSNSYLHYLKNGPDRKSMSKTSTAAHAKVAAAANQHTIPAIDRMMGVLSALAEQPDGATITALTAALALPRSTVYRILNTLEAHDVVQRHDSGCYRLGQRLRTLAAHVPSGVAQLDLAALAQPFLDEVAISAGHSVKLSVLDGEGVLVLVAAQGRRPYALGVTPGQRMPINAGAAGKLLFAFEPPERQVVWLSHPLAAFTSRTITDPKRLKAEAARIRRQGWAQDRGESAPSIYAFAAPIRDHGGQVLAALSIPFLHGTESEQAEDIRLAVIGLADKISKALTVGEVSGPLNGHA
jgi:DNA-binding IclR family transcriptional regulator